MKQIILCLLLISFLLSANASSATEATTTLPSSYLMKDVTITLMHQTGHRLPGSYVIKISGDKKATKTVDQTTTQTTTLTDKEFITLVNAFYSVYFFDYADRYTVKTNATLMETGQIKTFKQKMTDQDSQQLCLSISDYQKCVTIMDEYPKDLKQLIKKIESVF